MVRYGPAYGIAFFNLHLCELVFRPYYHAINHIDYIARSIDAYLNLQLSNIQTLGRSRQTTRESRIENRENVSKVA